MILSPGLGFAGNTKGSLLACQSPFCCSAHLFDFCLQFNQRRKSWHSSSFPIAMQVKSWFSGQEAKTYPVQVVLDSQGTEVEPSNLAKLQAHFLEYGRLLLTFLKLYLQSRILMSQNYLLTCKLRMWDAVFFYLRVQIVLIRLTHGFPVGECWPRK
jgi:hypothetical protein